MTFGVLRSAGSLTSRSIHPLSVFVEVSALLFLTFCLVFCMDHPFHHTVLMPSESRWTFGSS